MTITDCLNCGGIHYGSHTCPFNPAEPCIICGDKTIYACSDCAINSGGTKAVHVCERSACRDAHEAAAGCSPAPAAPQP